MLDVGSKNNDNGSFGFLDQMALVTTRMNKWMRQDPQSKIVQIGMEAIVTALMFLKEFLMTCVWGSFTTDGNKNFLRITKHDGPLRRCRQAASNTSPCPIMRNETCKRGIHNKTMTLCSDRFGGFFVHMVHAMSLACGPRSDVDQSLQLGIDAI